MTVQEVIDGAATLLGDAAKVTWTNAVLLPYVREAHGEIQNDLILNGFRSFDEISALVTITAGSSTMPAPPLSPEDFFLPQKIQEGQPNSGIFQDMTEKEWEPDLQPADSLRYWAFRADGLHFPAANQDRVIKLFYTKGTLSPATDPSDILNISNALPIYTAKTAHLAAAFKGRNPQAAGDLDGIYLRRLATYLTIEVKNRQALTYRRRPYSAHGITVA